MLKTDSNWNAMCRDIIRFMEKNKRRPSKHNSDDHRMLNWIKYNKKMKARGNMSPQRLKKFNELLTVAEKYRRLNKTTYMYPKEELSLKS